MCTKASLVTTEEEGCPCHQYTPRPVGPWSTCLVTNQLHFFSSVAKSFNRTQIQLNSHQRPLLTLHWRWKGVARWCRSVQGLGDKKRSVEKGKGSGEWYFSHGGGGDVDFLSNWTNERNWIIFIWIWLFRRLDCYDGQGNLVAARSVTIVTCTMIRVKMLLWWWWYVFCLL